MGNQIPKIGKNLPIWGNLDRGEMDTRIDKYRLAIDKRGTAGYQTLTRDREKGLSGVVRNYRPLSPSLRSLNKHNYAEGSRKVP